VVYLVRLLLRAVVYPLRFMRKAPDAVVFVLEGAYPDLPAPKEGFLRRRLMPRRTSLFELGQQLEHVACDRRVRGVMLRLCGLKLSMAQIQTVRGFISGLRERGKRVVVWAADYDMASYYLAAAADEILTPRGGGIVQLGLSRSYVFLGDVLGRIGLQADFVQISPYKTAGDLLTRTGMSDEARAMADWLLDDAYATITADIARDRGIEPEAAKALIDGAPYVDEAARAAGAIDGVLNEEELPAHLGGAQRPARLVPYAACRRTLRPRPLERPGGYVAVVRVAGTIVDGRSSRPPVKPPLDLPFLFNERAGDLTVVQQLRQALADRRAKAVVLFIDSGGGSATSSEAIASALSRVRETKPVVVCMATIAGSGGYYVAVPANHIVAQPGTITGSIGVIVGKLVDVKLLEKLLVHREVLERGGNAAFLASHHPFSDEERQRLFGLIQHIYSQFLDRVAKGREMSRDAVDAIGGGRVWTGRQALERGLVDELGGLDAALAKARELAGLHPRSRMVEIPIPKADRLGVPSPLSLFAYAKDGVDQLGRGRALYVCPLVRGD
jgi:protease IV